jgi:hypothetical protein
LSVISAAFIALGKSYTIIQARSKCHEILIIELEVLTDLLVGENQKDSFTEFIFS